MATDRSAAMICRNRPTFFYSAILRTSW